MNLESVIMEIQTIKMGLNNFLMFVIFQCRGHVLYFNHRSVT